MPTIFTCIKTGHELLDMLEEIAAIDALKASPDFYYLDYQEMIYEIVKEHLYRLREGG